MDYASRYAELAVRVGVNLQEGQKLVVYGEPEHAPLLRAVAEAGWRAGAGDVVCFYVDDHIRRLHALHAADELLDRTPAWLETAALDAEGAALVVVLGDADPELFSDVDPSRAARAEPRRAREIARDLTSRLATAWTVIACPTDGWASSLFGEPDTKRLWSEIAAVTRLDEADPVDAWWRHIATLHERDCDAPGAAPHGAPFPRTRHRPPSRTARGRALAQCGVPHVVGPGARAQPADGGGLHDTGLETH